LGTDLHDELLPIRGNAAQIRQVVMNLVINASEAIGDKHGVEWSPKLRQPVSRNLSGNF